jgi:cysteinyl-tRNA synthetase
MLRLTDTRTRQIEEIRPATAGLLKLYACGPTVYRYAHVGNLRTFLLHDLITRAAQLHGWRTRVVQNITDVGHLVDDSDPDPTGEDKVLAAARQEGRSVWELTRHYEDAFHHDCRLLNIRPADVNPRASESIELIISLIQRLVDAGNAYAGPDGSVFFDATSFPSYGAISGNQLAELRPGHGLTGESTAVGKRFHADWALWKAAGRSREMVWESPWGPGFPGWHVECSAMSLHYLGETIDVHTAGTDLRFPHHEDERAQSEAAVGHEVVRYWVHGEHLLFDGRKMAKSTRNVVLLSDVVSAGYDPLALRLFFLQGRYRQQINLTWAALAAADRLLSRWRAKVAEWAESPSKPMCADYVARVTEAVDADLDTATALLALRELEKDSSVPPGSKFETFVYLDRVLGLDLAAEIGRPKQPISLPLGAQELLDRRAAARERRDWVTSDELRSELAGMGVCVVDSPDGQQWRLSQRD